MMTRAAAVDLEPGKMPEHGKSARFVVFVDVVDEGHVAISGGTRNFSHVARERTQWEQLLSVSDDHDVAHVGVLLNLWMIPCIDVVAAMSVAVASLPAVAAFIRAGAVIGPCGGARVNVEHFVIRTSEVHEVDGVRLRGVAQFDEGRSFAPRQRVTKDTGAA